jgi:hypothetical protein
LIAAAVYILGTGVTLACAVLLIRGYAQGRRKLLLWSAICFFGLSLSNFLVFLDLIVFPKIDLYLWRLVTAAIAMLFLLYGLIWEGNR